MNPIARFFHWLGTPFRALARGLMVLVCLSPRQIQSLVTLFVSGGIIVYSWQAWFYVLLARNMARDDVPAESPAWQVLQDSAANLFWLTLACVATLCLIAWGAKWLSVKYRDADFSAGKTGASQ